MIFVHVVLRVYLSLGRWLTVSLLPCLHQYRFYFQFFFSFSAQFLKSEKDAKSPIDWITPSLSETAFAFSLYCPASYSSRVKRGFFFLFPQTNSITLPAVRTLFKTFPLGRERKENCVFPLQRTKPSQICTGWYGNKQVFNYSNCCNEWDKQKMQDNTPDLHTGWSQIELDLRNLLLSQPNIHVSTRRNT
jgi:hypothetical protein